MAAPYRGSSPKGPSAGISERPQGQSRRLEQWGVKRPEALEANQEQDPSDVIRETYRKQKLHKFAEFGRKFLRAVPMRTRNSHQPEMAWEVFS